MFGVKRVMINGLKGGQTPVLVNDIPTQPLLSGFNGLDSAAMVGVVSVEIARGESASSTALKAIGGTVNGVLKIPLSNRLEIDLLLGGQCDHKVAIVLAGITPDGTGWEVSLCSLTA